MKTLASKPILPMYEEIGCGRPGWPYKEKNIEKMINKCFIIQCSETDKGKDESKCNSVFFGHSKSMYLFRRRNHFRKSKTLNAHFLTIRVERRWNF